MNFLNSMKKLSRRFLLLAAVIMGMMIPQQLYAQNSGDEKPTITITEYSDYQCPACAAYHPVVKKLKEQYGEQINLNLKYYPLNSHQYAALAARAAQAAKNQGKFREMHNLIFVNQKRWVKSGNPTSVFVNFARHLGLDMQQFSNDLNAAETQRIVMEQKEEGRQQGVNATPTFFIEGEKIETLPRSYAEFDQLVQKYLKEKGNSK